MARIPGTGEERIFLYYICKINGYFCIDRESENDEKLSEHAFFENRIQTYSLCGLATYKWRAAERNFCAR